MHGEEVYLLQPNMALNGMVLRYDDIISNTKIMVMPCISLLVCGINIH